MPFPDELWTSGVEVVPYRPEWVDEADALRRELLTPIPIARAVEHIGSTAVPGMAAKDCLDVMVVVDDLEPTGAFDGVTVAGWRLRPEPWNRTEDAGGRSWPKLVPAGASRAGQLVE